jgi:ureidoacrylate peracid hydrolase
LQCILARRRELGGDPLAHPLKFSPSIVERVIARCGRPHPMDVIDAPRTALVVVDMQNYFMKPGYIGEVPKAREIVPAINRMAAELRARGGHVAWVVTSTDDTRESWSVYHDVLLTPERRDRRYQTMLESDEGYKLWPSLEARPGDWHVIKKMFSAFIQGSSDLEARLRARNIDTVLIAGTTTHICCESTARDAMMRNFKVVMVADALATFTDEEHQASLNTLYTFFGDVQTVDETIQSLDRGSRLAKAS